MRTLRLLTLGALSASLIVPMGVVAQAPADHTFAATLTLKPYTKDRVVGLSAGKVNVPVGKTVNAWFLKQDAAPDPGPSATGWKAAPTTFKLADQDGEQTVHVWARATGGVVSDSGNDTTFLDRVAPTIDVITTTPTQTVNPDPDPVISSRTVSISFSYTDPGELTIAGVPVTGAGVSRYAVVNGTTPPVPGSTAWKLVPVGEPAIASHTVPSGNGAKTVSVFVRDRASNVSAASTVDFTLLIAGPTITITQLADYTKTNKPSIKLVAKNASNVVLQNASFLVKVTPTNSAPTAPAANAAGWKTAISTVTLPGEGTNYIWAWAKDVNGTISSTPATDSISWDNDAPTGTFDIFEGLTLDRTVLLAATANDGLGSGVARFALVNSINPPTLASDWKALGTFPAIYTLPFGNGSKTVSMFLKDNAGNVAGPFTDTVTMAIAAPSLTFNIVKTVSNSLTVNISADPTDTGGTGIAGYFISETNITPAAGATGWKSGLSTFILSAGQGTRTLHAWVKDTNKSVSAVASDTVLIDTVKPTATMTASGLSLTVSGTDIGGSGITHYIVKITTGVTPAIPATPAANDAGWKSTANDATSAVSGATGNRATLFTKDAAGNISDVDTTGPDVNTLILVGP